MKNYLKKVLKEEFKISQASWFFDKHYYENEDIMSWYRRYIAKILRSFNSNNDDLSGDIYEMVEIERKLARVYFQLKSLNFSF